MSKFLSISIGAVATIVATSMIASYAPAPQATVSAVPSFYVSAGLGYGLSDDIGDQIIASLLNAQYRKRGFIWNAALGYQFSKVISLEAGYMQLPEEQLSFLGVTTRVKHKALTGAAKLSYPFSSVFSVHAKLGCAYQELAVTDSTSSSVTDKATLLYGLGIGYKINQHFSVSLEGISTPTSGGIPATYLAFAGVSYTFV